MGRQAQSSSAQPEVQPEVQPEAQPDAQPETVETISASGGDEGELDLAVGTLVQARHKGGKEWHLGKIIGVTEKLFDGGAEEKVYEVEYDDGDVEADVWRYRVVRREDGIGEQCKELAEGERVDVRYRREQQLFPGKIARNNDDDTYDVIYNDGEWCAVLNIKFAYDMSRMQAITRTL